MTRVRLLALALAASACANGGGSPPSPEASSPGLPAETAWRLVSMDGRPVPDRPGITLELDSARVGGFAGCNAYGGSLTTGPGGVLSVGEMSSTAAACAEAADMGREVEYLRVLAGVTAARSEGPRLVLETAPGEAPLVYEPIPPSTGDAAATLVGTSWRLESLDGRWPRGRYTMAFPEGGVAVGEAGCRRYRASYQVEGGRIFFPRLEMEGEPCDELALEEGAFTDALSWSAWFDLSARSWVLRGVRGERLVFARDGPGGSR